MIPTKAFWFRALTFFALIGFSLIHAYGANASWNYVTATGALNTTYSWINCASGATITSNDDAAGNVSWPFKFTFFDDQYTTSNNLSVCTNGFIRLDGTADSYYSSASGYNLESSAALGQIIAMGTYDNKVGDNGGWTRSLVTGTAPTRIFTIEYNQMEIDYNDSRYANVQVSFYEASEKVVVKYNSSNIKPTGVDVGIHSGVSSYYHLAADLYGSKSGWIEYTPRHVTVTASAGTTNALYTTLKEAFDAINNGTHKGQVTVNLTGNTYEAVTANLNASGTGGADYSSVNIYPTVSSAMVYGLVDGPVINLNGADHVTIDGRVNATGSNADLIIYNGSTGTGAITVQLNNAAQSNTMQYCKLYGGGGSSSNGTVTFGGSGANSSNTVSYCTLTNNGSRRENTFYVASGSNTGNTLSYSSLFDNWSSSANSSAVKLGWGSADWTFTGNSVYETTAFEPSGGYAYYGFNIDHSGGSNYVLSGNYIGGTQPQCGGTALTMGTVNLQPSTLCPIYLNVGTTASSVQGNIIKNITYKSAASTPFVGIQVISGSVNIGNIAGNAIGDTISTGSLALTASATAAISYGIMFSSPAAATVSNNQIGSITLANSISTNGHSFYGIHKAWGSGDYTVSNNAIGSQSVASSIQSTSTSTSNDQYLVGIYSEATATSLYEGNIVANLRNNTTRDNASNYVYGICLSGAATNTVSKNFITNLSCSSTGTNNVVAGFCTLASGGTSTVSNNVIALGNGLDNALYSINGILNNSGSTESYYHNTVYLRGTVSGSTAINTAAFAKKGWVTGITLTNNLFVNTRSGGTGSGKHAAIILNNKSITSDYNNLYAPGTNGVAGVDGSTPYSTLGAWYTATSLDVNSSEDNPAFFNPGGTYPLAYYPASDMFGTDLRLYVSTDFGGYLRNDLSTLGAWERPLTYNVEVYNGSTLLNRYMYVKNAFDAINNGTHTGDLTIKLVGNVKEKASAVLNASGSGSSNYSNVTIYPTMAGLTFSGTVNGPLISLNGADHVILDGRVNRTGSTPNLTVINKSVDVQSVTIQLNNASQSNTIRYCIIQGGGGSSTNATVLFGEAGANSNNTIDNCWITQNGTVRQFAVSSTGANLNGTISNNSLFDTWATTVGSSSISLGSGASGWTVSGNSIYATSSFAQGAYTYYGISVNSPTGTGFAVSNNHIGGSAPLSTGSLVLSGTGATQFYPIYLTVGSTAVSTISGNTIRNLNYTSTSATPFSAIRVDGGSTLISANQVGEGTGTGSITLINSYTQATSYGIYLSGTGRAELVGNGIGSITTTNTAPDFPHNFCGIYKTNSAGDLIVRSNTIGSESTTNSVLASPASTSFAQTLYGIYSQGTDLIVISGNTIANLNNGTTNTTNSTRGSLVGIYATTGTDSVYSNTVRNVSIANANTAADHTASLIGISITSTTPITVNDNAVYALSNTYNSFAGSVIGLYYAGGTTGTNTVFNNFIRTLTTTSASGAVYGVKMASGATTYHNNIIVLSNPTASSIYGMYETGASGNNNNLYFNTIYIYGALSSGTNKTYALYSAVKTNTRVFVNNLLVNARSTTGGSNLHYAIYYAAAGTQSTITTNYNDYLASGTGGVIGFYNGANKTNKTVVNGQDANSLNTNPSFANKGGSYLLPNDLMTNITLAGTPVSGIVVDYLLLTRSTTAPTIGAFQFYSNIDAYSGSTLVASFSTLGLAFSSISSGSNNCTGAITLKVNRSTTETATATLGASGTNGASYTRVLITPTLNNVSISGTLNSALVNLNGADNVCFDGRLNGAGTTQALNLVNLSTELNAVTLQFNNTAQFDTIRYCVVKGGGSGTNNGTILFGTSGTNSQNSIDNCIITNNGSRRAHAIYSITGSNTTNTVSNNAMFDTWSTTISSNFIKLESGATDWTISGNSFYETTSLLPAGAYTYVAINLNNTSGNGYVVSANHIGGQGPQCSGSSLKLGVDGTAQSILFYPIYCNTGTTNPTSVQGNVIRNISFRSSNAAPFAGIYINNGLANIGTTSGNMVGDSTGIGSIQLTGTVTVATSYGIYLGSTANLAVSNNHIGSITTTTNNTAYAHGFYAISKSATAGNTLISGNKVGSESTPASIQASSSATSNSQVLFGIYSAGTGNTVLLNNKVANLSNNTTETNQGSRMYGVYIIGGTNRVLNNSIHDLTTGGAANGSNYANVCMTGIVVTPQTGFQTISNNTIFNLLNTSTQKVEFYGIYMRPTTSGNDTISGNFIHGFKMASESTTCYLHGISFVNDAGTYTGTISLYNNIVFLGDSITTGCSIFGILKNTTKTTNIYHNTVHLGGTVADASTVSSYAIRDRTDGTPNLRDIKNNIFYNTRSGGGSNYALYFHVKPNISIDYNDYGWSGTYFAEVNSENQKLVILQQWLDLMAGNDQHSLIINPQFERLDGNLATDYKTLIGLDGTAGLGITTDYGGSVRSTGNPTMGAWECFSVDVYNGSTFRASYPNLKGAFDAINAGTWTNNLTIRLKGSTLETQTAQLNASGTGSASYSQVTVLPIRNQVVISGEINGDLILLNGADHVVIDGRINGTGTQADMILTNKSTGATANTIRFAESSCNNTIQYCNLQGAGTGSASGILHFSTASVGEGNDNNTITRCIITGTPTSRPYNAVYALGTTNRENSANTLVNNIFINNWVSTSDANSVRLDNGNTDWIISGNSFYHDASFTPGGAFTYSFLYINSSTGQHTLSGNFMGGTTEQCLGPAMQLGSTAQAAVFRPLYLNVASTGTGTSVQGNLISNLAITSTASTPFTAVYVAGGKVKMGTTTPNQIGGLSGNDNLLLTAYASGASSYGLYISGSDSVEISNNVFGAITATNNSNSNAHNLSVIHASGSGTIRLISNTIGSLTTTGSVRTTSTSTGVAQNLRGIYYDGTGSLLVQLNTLANLFNSSTNNVVGNVVTGIYKAGSGTARISQNFMIGLTNSGSGVNPILEGINLANGSTACINNVVNVGSTSLGYLKVYGIRETGVNGFVDSICHNTVFLSGAVSGTLSTALSYAYYKETSNGPGIVLDNIFYNTRSSGGTSSRHYGIFLPSNTSVSVLNGNDYYITATYGRIGKLNTQDYSTLSTWKNAVGKDANSTDVNPNLANPGGSSALDYKTSAVLIGVPSSIIIDFSGSSRSLTQPTIGAWEYALCIEVYSSSEFKKAYTTLKAAFDDINTGTWTGNLTVKILKSTYEINTATLLASGSGPSYSRVLIYPTNTGVSVTGSINGPLVCLSGADYVTIDGRIDALGTTPDLLFSNINKGSNASTLQFLGGTVGDTLQYCILNGAGTGAATGVVHFAAGTASSGNSNNVVRNCLISGTNATDRPTNALYSSSSNNTNSNNTIQGNQFYNTLSPTASSNVIHIADNSTAFSISGNSFYETTLFTPTTANEYALIRIANTSGQDFSLIGNYFGGNAPQATGTWVKLGTGSTFYGIHLNVGTSTASSVNGNILRNISYTNNGNSAFTGINVAGGKVNIMGNLIGSSTGNASIVVTNSTSGGTVYGIAVLGTGEVQCSNNSLGSITVANSSSANATNFNGIFKDAVAGNITIQKNLIGSLTTDNSIYASSDAYYSSQLVIGINCKGTGVNLLDSNNVVNVTNKTLETIQASKIIGIYAGEGTNTIQRNVLSRLTNNGSASGASGENAPVIGLLVKSTLNSQQVTGNTITQLMNNATAKIHVYGIYYYGPTSGTNQLSTNFINRILLPLAPPESVVSGCYLAQGAAQVNNNIIAIGDSLAQGLTMHGLYNNSSGTLTIYHNTLYIGGSVSTALSNTYAFLNNVTGSHNLRNNLFANLRSGGGKHYAISLSGVTPATVINYNCYYAGGTNGVIGYLNSDKTILPAWKSATSQDVYSISNNPLFMAPGSTHPVDYTPTASMTMANVLLSEDYSGEARQNPPTAGALEFSGFFWTGTIDTDWSKPGNWLPTIVPTVNVNANIPYRVNKPAINNGVAAHVNKLTIFAGAVVTINPGGTLTVATDVVNNAGLEGLVINSTDQGTGSLITSQAGLTATVNRYIIRQHARDNSWFSLSSPVAAQAIRGSTWTPSGGYADGSGYDLFVWDEATSAWIYNLNDTTTIDKKWSVAHPEPNFVPGRGYLYSLYDSISTKAFVGTLNAGAVSVPLTISGSGLYKGFQLVGNPYPSSMDWKSETGFDRSKLTPSGSGYDVWMWSSTANNYGVYNSSLTGNEGTNNASRYISPMQGFFVCASQAGNLVFNNDARVHTDAGDWLRSSGEADQGAVRLNVVSSSGNGSDEVMLRFGGFEDKKGSAKLFSPVNIAPSLYLPLKGKNYSIRMLSTVENNKTTPVSFKPGSVDTFTMTCELDESFADSVFLEDKLTGRLHNFAEEGSYSFTAAPGDAADRFVLHYGTVSLNKELMAYRIYVTNNNAMINLEHVSGKYDISLFDINGRKQENLTVFGGGVYALPLPARGNYIISIRTESTIYNHKLVH